MQEHNHHASTPTSESQEEFFQQNSGEGFPESMHEDPMDKSIQRRTLWRRFGGDGFLVSLVVHVVLIMVAIFWVISTFVVGGKQEEDNTFGTGAGGGTRGDHAKIYEHRIKPKHAQSMVRTPSKVAVKGASSAIAIQDMPDLNMSSMMSGNLDGGSSKGDGGGSGGGIGTGQGIGVGGGKNFVSSLFGGSGWGANAGLVGTFYDLKQKANGSTTEMMENTPESRQIYVDRVRAFVRGGFRESGSMATYFKSPVKLVTKQVFMPSMPASAATGADAFNVPQVRPSRWLVHYAGSVRAPKTGSFRFVGMADDILAVSWNRMAVLDAGHDLVTVTNKDYNGTGHHASKDFVPRNGTGDRFTDEEQKKVGSSGEGGGWRVGRWIDVKKGDVYQMDVVIGETPGGEFGAYLILEEAAAGTRRKGGGKFVLFRIGSDPLPEKIANEDAAVNCDMSGGEWVWEATERRGIAGSR